MPRKNYLVTLSAEERGYLGVLVSSGKRSARTLSRAHILLKADQADGGPAWDDVRIADAFGCGRRTVERVRQRFVEAGRRPDPQASGPAEPDPCPRRGGRGPADRGGMLRAAG